MRRIFKAKFKDGDENLKIIDSAHNREIETARYEANCRNFASFELFLN